MIALALETTSKYSTSGNAFMMILGMVIWFLYVRLASMMITSATSVPGLQGVVNQ